MKTIQRLGGWESEAAMSRYLHAITPELATAANNRSKALLQCAILTTRLLSRWKFSKGLQPLEKNRKSV